MTSARQTMSFGTSRAPAGPTRRPRRAGPGTAGLVALAAALAGAGCAGTRPAPRETLVSPERGPELWAVVPPRNESGVSTVDEARVADMIAETVQHVTGLDALPVNRTLLAMQRLGLDAIGTPGEAAAVLNLLDADGLVVGTITAWDPYPPPKIGLALQLFRRHREAAAPTIDPATIARTTQGEVAPGVRQSTLPAGTAAGVFDARDQQTLGWLEAYAASRHAPDSAYGPGIFLVDVDLFAQFVSHRLLRDLLRPGRAVPEPLAANRDFR